MAAILSVAMGAYNCASTLEKSLDSLAQQTFKDFICYICDDGSTDSTRVVIENYCKKDPRFVLLVNEKNMGLSHSLNKCISQCTTKYIARMDGDDISLPERFATQIDFLETHPEIDFCGSAITYFDDNGTWGRGDFPEYPKASDFLFVSPFAHPTIMYRASSLEKIKDPETGWIYSEDKKIGRSEDYDLFMRMHAAGLKSYNFQKPLILYREDANSYAKRKFKYVITDARVRLRNFKKLKLMPKGYLYVLKPFIVALVPKKLRARLHKRKFDLKQ